MKLIFILLFLTGCAGLDPSDYIQETPDGNVFVPYILDPENLITCKKVAYCLYEEEWEECVKGREDAKNVHFEVICVDLAREEPAFFIPLDEWKTEHRHDFGEYRNEDIFKILNNLDYIKANLNVYKNEIPPMVEKYKKFHSQ